MTIAKRSLKRAATSTVIALGLAVGVTLAAAGTAQARSGEGDGSCDGGEVCLYFNRNLSGASATYYCDVPDYGDDQFQGRYKDGYGWQVHNHASSARNRAAYSGVRIFYNPNYNNGNTNSAPSQWIPANSWANLIQSGANKMENENASHRFSYGGNC